MHNFRAGYIKNFQDMWTEAFETSLEVHVLYVLIKNYAYGV